MKNQEKPSTENLSLRAKAELAIKNLVLPKELHSEGIPENVALKFIHELEVHQVELELQNEELVHAKANLQISLNKYSNLYDFAPIGYFTLSTQGTIIEVNFRGAQIFSKDRSRLVKAEFGFLIAKDSRLNFADFLERIFMNQSRQTCEVSLVNSDAQIEYYHLSGVVSPDREVCLVSMSDVSERKRAEEALKESEDRFQMLFEEAPLGYQSLDIDGNFIEVNQQWLQMFGYSRQEVIGKSFAEFVIPGLLEGFFEQFKSFKLNGCIHSEFEMLTKSGRKRFIAFEGKIGYTPTGKFKQTHCILQDVTLQKHAEEKAHSLNWIVQESFNEIFIFDAVTFQFLFANKGALRNLGYSMDELLKISPVDIKPEFSHEGFEELIRPLDRGVINKFTFETIHQRKDGTQYPIEVYLQKSTFDQQAVFVAIILDITERKNAYQEIEKKNKQLLEANIEKDKFFSIIAHDLKSPFNVFLGATEIIQKEFSNLTQDQIQRLVGSLHGSAKKLYELLENLLAWSRMQRGVTSFNPEIIPLTEFVSSVMHLNMEIIVGKQISFNTDIPEEMEVYADPNMLNSILRNLVSNAMKFTKSGGTIVLSAHADTDEKIEITVSDTGIGMSREILSNIFSLTENVSRPGTEGEPSTGLGLLLCKEFVKKHGGEIWVESEEGKGSAFSFTMPLAKTN